MDSDDSRLIDELKATVETRHRNALRAIETLRDFLTENMPASDMVPNRPPIIGELIAYLHGNGSVRERVRRAIQGRYLSVEEIVAETGLTRTQVRGVVYAKDVREKLQRDRSSGPMRFRLSANGDL
jgi:hypothetical protein